MKYYTIFIGEKLWTNVVDDMNTQEIWSIGGMLWTSKKKAVSCINSLKKYGFETENKKFSVQEVKLI